MDEYLTIFEVAELTKYTVGTLRKFVQKGRVAFHKWGRSLRFKRAEIELWMKQGCGKAVYLPADMDEQPKASAMETGVKS